MFFLQQQSVMTNMNKSLEMKLGERIDQPVEQQQQKQQQQTSEEAPATNTQNEQTNVEEPVTPTDNDGVYYIFSEKIFVKNCPFSLGKIFVRYRKILRSSPTEIFSLPVPFNHFCFRFHYEILNVSKF